jgi:hypothetical protein
MASQLQRTKRMRTHSRPCLRSDVLGWWPAGTQSTNNGNQHCEDSFAAIHSGHWEG